MKPFENIINPVCNPVKYNFRHISVDMLVKLRDFSTFFDIPEELK